jgi:hypothetical protein
MATGAGGNMIVRALGDAIRATTVAISKGIKKSIAHAAKYAF